MRKEELSRWVNKKNCLLRNTEDIYLLHSCKVWTIDHTSVGERIMSVLLRRCYRSPTVPPTLNGWFASLILFINDSTVYNKKMFFKIINEGLLCFFNILFSKHRKIIFTQAIERTNKTKIKILRYGSHDASII